MATADELKATRATTKASITRIKTHIDKNEDTSTLPELECRLGLLEAYFKQILYLQDSIDKFLPGDEIEIKKRSEVEELYICVKSKILRLMSERKRDQSATPKEDDIHNQTIYVQPPKSSTLAKLKLPKFSGQYTDYPNFIQQFTSRVDNEASLSTIDKFTHLEECLVGDAKLVIKSLDIVASNYKKALQMLKERYDNKCIIIQSHIRKLFELPNVSKNSATQLRNLVDSIDGHIRALHSLGENDDIFNAMLLHLVVSKLDTESLSKWEDSLNLEQLPTWEECSWFLSKRCQHLENREIINKTAHQQQQKSFNRSNKSSNSNQRISLTASQLQCSYCKQSNHTVQKCKKFLELTVMNRFVEAKKLSLCLNCLLVGHPARQCQSSKCKVCNGLHNTLLHRFGNMSSSTQLEPSYQPKVSSTVNTQEPVSHQKVLHSSLTVENSSTIDNGVLLATAVITIKDKLGSFVPIRVLLDSASQLNFITEFAAQTLGLKKKKICETISGIGDINSKIRHKTSTTIRSTINDFETNIDLWILPSITTPQPEVKLNIENWHIPQDVVLADSQFSEPQKIDLLIGAELFFDLLLEEKIKLGLGMPTLINTVFGWIVSGNYTRTENQQLLNSLVSTIPNGDDDLISGANTRAEMIEIRTQIESIFKLANLELRKWFSNDKKFINDIPENEREKPLRINDLEIIKALGIVWEPVLDEFRFVNSINESDQNITKRSVLSDLSRLFDPLGLVSPVVVLAKIFMQSLWILKLDWDTSIPDNLATQWRTYRSQLHNLNKIRIPRRIFSSHIAKCDLHGFADASLRAYGCCLYTRCEDASGNVVVRLLGAKSKVAPVSTESLPRLELNAALLLAKLLNRVSASLDKQFDKIQLWTDSEIVLDWLSDHPSSWETYIANRVSIIQQLTVNALWRHVNSKANPADIVSRGSLADDLLQSIWFTGPDFLYKTENLWPRNKERKPKEHIPGKRKIKSILTSTIANEKTSDMVVHHKFVNNFTKIRRTFAYCIRFFKNLQSKLNNVDGNFGPLNARELDDAFLRLIWHIQRQSFKDEITVLEKCNQFLDKGRKPESRNIQLHKNSSIKALNPFLDTTSNLSLLKVGGRLRNSDLPDLTKYPILIPKNHPLSYSYINYLHISNFHAGAQSLVSITRQRIWILDVKRIARRVVHDCIRCFKSRPKLLEQIMGDLPSHRVRPARPFWNCGVDFCGPIHTTQRIRGRGPIKSYVAVFVCFVTKAVHLEVVSTLSSDGFVAALKRFVARRGICRNLYCDNATNFVGARNELAEFSKFFQAKETIEKILNYCSDTSIEFHHIPPRSPHFGGLWEAAVKSAKYLMVRTIGTNILTFEELTTAMVQIEAILNSRPITPMSSDPNDDSALTPGHFLVGGPLNAIAEPDVTHQKSTLLHRWQQVRALQQTFWNRWRKEYVTQLQQRYKWNSSSTDVKVGTLVLIHEDNVPPQRWLLGRITETIIGNDGHVRVVNIRTKNGVIKRAINKLAPLPFEDN